MSKSDDSTREGPLAGIKVLEMSTVVAAPTTARLMAIYGADVIKVEAPSGDAGREMGAAFCCTTVDYANPCFDLHNAGKRFGVIDLKNESGHAVFMELMNKADVFITNIRPQALTHLGINYDVVKEQNPRLIYAHLSGYGQSGPDCDRPGFDNSAFWMRSGPVLEWLAPGSEPMNPSYGFGDIVSGTDLYSGILAGLIGRERTGKGTLVTTSLYGNGIWCNGESLIHVQPQYGRKFKVDRYHPHDPFAKTYLTQDNQYIAIYGVSFDRSKEKMKKLFDIGDLLSDPRAENYKTLRETEFIVQIVKRMEEIFASKTADEWCKIFLAADIAHERLRDYNEVYKDPQAFANGYLKKVTMGDGNITAMPSPPIEFSDYDKAPVMPTGPMGQSTDEVMAELGYTKEQVQALREAHAIK